MDYLEMESVARARREAAHAAAERQRLLRRRRSRRAPRLRHRLAHALIALALWIDDAPRRAPRLAGT